MEAKYKYLQFIPYATIRNWSVQYMLGNDFSYSDKYPLVCIGSFLIRNKTTIDVQDNVDYKQVTVRTNNGGVCMRDVKKGKDIGTKKQNVVRKGQYIVSKIDARNGAFGIIPEELDGAIVTNDFPVFDVDASIINTEFLLLVTTTKKFVAFAQSCSSGTTNRRRIDIDKFLDQMIPLPSLEEQKNLVNSYVFLMTKASDLFCKAEEMNQECDTNMSKKLGDEVVIKKDVEGNCIDKYHYLQLFHSRSIMRWDVWNVKWTKTNSLYRQTQLCNVLSLQSGQFLPSKKQEGGDYIVYGGNGETGRHNEYCYSGKTIVIGRVGEYCGNVHLVDGKYWVTDNALKVDKLTDEVSWEYLSIALTNLNLNDYKSISAQPSISQKRILQMSIPVPPKEIQDDIVSYVKAAKERMKALKAEAESLKVQALHDFEKALFK